MQFRDEPCLSQRVNPWRFLAQLVMFAVVVPLSAPRPMGGGAEPNLEPKDLSEMVWLSRFVNGKTIVT